VRTGWPLLQLQLLELALVNLKLVGQQQLLRAAEAAAESNFFGDQKSAE
jgi:hypothetical protein